MATQLGHGSTVYNRYAFESTFGTAPADSALTTQWGHNVKFNRTAKSNLERVYNLGTRDATKYVTRKFEGTWSAEFEVSNWYFMKAVLGSVATTGAGPYTHTYNVANVPPSLTIQQSEDLDTNSEITMVGCLIDKFSLNMNVGDVVTARLDGVYLKETKDSTLNTNGNTQDSEEPFTFAHCTVEKPNGTVLTEVQNMTWDFTNSAELVWGLGSKFATQRIFNQRQFDFSLNQVREADVNILDDFYGGTTAISNPNNPANITTLEIIVTNGLSSTNQRSFTALFDALQVDEYGLPVNPNELLKEGSKLQALNLNTSSKAVYTNNTSTHP